MHFLQVSYSRPNTADIKDTNLYVGNVPQVEATTKSVLNPRTIEPCPIKPSTVTTITIYPDLCTLPQGVSEADLERLFGQHGSLLTKKLLRDQGGKNKGIAFVRWQKSLATTLLQPSH